MKSPSLTTLRCFLLLTLVTGMVYPALITLLGGLLFSNAAAGSFVTPAGAQQPQASLLVGQNFQGQDQFWGRLSQTAETPYNAMASGGSNLGSANPTLAANARLRLQALGVSGPVPVDLVTSSASGLDPHISPEAARVQIPRVAKAMGKSPEQLEQLVAHLTEPATLGILGQPRVNVVRLNLELKRLP